jgi:hypothetical protein
MSDDVDRTPLRADAAYRVAGDHILSRRFEDELTLINLQDGGYFAAGGAASAVWQAFEAPAFAGRVAEIVGSSHSGDAGVIRADIERFCAELLAHRLIVEHGLIEESATPAVMNEQAMASQTAVTPWPGLWIEAYGDMKELLLLDPIHDVGEGAWPPAPLIWKAPIGRSFRRYFALATPACA